MAKTLKQFLEKTEKFTNKNLRPEDQPHVEKMTVDKHEDRNGNGDDVFKGKTKPYKRAPRHGYDAAESERVYEELKGGQKNLDKNHNGKLDAHDFKLLRKKKVAEEAESVDEGKWNYPKHMTKTVTTSDMDTTNAARNREERKAFRKKQKAKAHAALMKGMRKEEVEDLEELDASTLKSYRTKARAQGNAIVDKMKMGGGDWSKDQKDTKTLRKRAAGAQMSGKKLVKRGESLKTEEVEELDELSKATLGSYAHKAKDQLSKAEYRAGVKMGTRHMGAKPDAQERAYNVRANKRHAGLTMAIDKLAKEEVENIEEAGYSAKSARAGKDIGKPGKQFAKIAASAAKRYGSKKSGENVAGAVLAKLRKEERLAELLGDLSETHRRTMMSVFKKLNEENKSVFLESCSTQEGIDKMLDFSIKHRGE